MVSLLHRRRRLHQLAAFFTTVSRTQPRAPQWLCARACDTACRAATGCERLCRSSSRQRSQRWWRSTSGSWTLRTCSATPRASTSTAMLSCTTWASTRSRCACRVRLPATGCPQPTGGAQQAEILGDISGCSGCPVSLSWIPFVLKCILHPCAATGGDGLFAAVRQGAAAAGRGRRQVCRGHHLRCTSSRSRPQSCAHVLDPPAQLHATA